MKTLLPDSCTCCNLLCGCIGTAIAFAGNMPLALLFIICGALCDFADGFVARGVRVVSPIGKELDSLADSITFGMCPATMLYCTLSHLSPLTWLPYTAFLIAIFSAVRLAKFNIDTRQTLTFIGLPTPANALLWAALLTAYSTPLTTLSFAVPLLLSLVAITCFLLVSEIPMFAMKFTSWQMHDKENALRYSFLAIATVIIIITIICGNIVSSLVYIILTYIVLSLVRCYIKH